MRYACSSDRVSNFPLKFREDLATAHFPKQRGTPVFARTPFGINMVQKGGLKNLKGMPHHPQEHDPRPPVFVRV